MSGPVRRVAALLVAATLLGACSGPTDGPQRDPGSEAGGELLLPTTDEPANLKLPSGEPLELRLPPGLSARLDPTAVEPTLVIVIPDTQLGFDLGSEVPTDPDTATRLVADLVASMASTGKVNLTDVHVTGYASSDGTTEANQQLSERRARWVCTALLTAGLAPNALTCAGQGESTDLDPPGPGPEDRRVEIRARTP